MRQQRTRVKICGIMRSEDARAAVEAGADALGVVFAESKRRVDLATAASALADVPPPVARIGVFVDADPAFIAEAVAAAGLTAVQLHGSEDPETCASIGVPVIKALRVGGPGSRGELTATMVRYRGRVSGLLVDAFSPLAAGGTGTAFDWEMLGRLDDMQVPVFAAGGLDVENVGEAIRVMRPFAVDVSSGVETAPGIKDADAIRRFVAAVRAADLEVDR